MEDFKKYNFKTRLHVARNSIYIGSLNEPSWSKDRHIILFVGTLNSRKGLDRLINIYSQCIEHLPLNIKLILIGDGPERENIVRIIHNLKLEEKVQLFKQINDNIILRRFYDLAIVSVSLSQAGLSVLQSMGYGVPFFTIKGSISGGETYNIINDVNGILVDDDDTSIMKSLIEITTNKLKAAELGRAAYEHYKNYATIEKYAQSFFDVIEGTDNAVI